MELLEIVGLTTSFATPTGTLTAVDDLNLTVRQGLVLGLVGESGCGKTITALSILNLVPSPGRITAGRIVFEGTDLLTLPEEKLRSVRGARISMVFQEPMTALNPVFTVGNQISEVLTTHLSLGKNEALERSIDLLRSVGIPSPEKRIHEYPHQLSGGMRQRVMIAMAISCTPSLVLADEPTTALDVTIQAHILELLARIQEKMGMALMLVTHDLGLIAERAHEVAVMYAGKIVEQADTLELFRRPTHPYTRGLMASLPSPGGTKRSRLKTIPGTVPRLAELPTGCRFAPRCELRGGICDQAPELVEITPGHMVRCWKAT